MIIFKGIMEGIFSDVIIFIFGASIGSFSNVLIDRLPNNQPISGRSHCDFCGKKIAWYDLFPVFSFFFLGAKSRCCNKKLSWQYPAVEIIMGGLFLLIFKNQAVIFNKMGDFNLQIFGLLVMWGIIACLLIIFLSDFKYHLISDYILWALFIFSVFYVVLTNNVNFDMLSISKLLTGSFMTGIVVALPIFLIYYISHERAMGLGDVYLSLIMGLLLGWKEGYIALYIAFVTGAIFGIYLLIRHKKRIKSKIAFGPFLVFGTVIMLFWGSNILSAIRIIYGY